MKKRLTAVTLTLLILVAAFFTAAPASAESYTVYVTSNTLKVYSKVSTSSSVMGTLSYGESMTCLATNNSWAAVKNSSGKIGYCKISGLSIKNPNTLNKTAYINTANVPIYRRPDTGASVMAKLAKNSKFTAVAVTPDKEWVRLKNGKYYGYVQFKYLSASIAQEEGSGSGNTVQDNLDTTVYVISNTLKAYSKASTSASILGTMSYGESMTLQAISGEWARIRNDSGAVGYCKLSGLSNVNPNSYSTKIYISANGVKVYRSPSTSAGVMQILNQNDSYTCVAITPDGEWLRLKNGKYYGYVQSKYASNMEIKEEEPESAEQLVYVSANSLPVYQSASSTSTKLGTMSFGESLILMSVDDGWARVRNDSGSTGYCLYGGLTKTNPNTLQKAYYAASDGVKLYAQPSESASIIKTVAINTPVAVIALSEDGAWGRVNLGGSQYAYVAMKQLSETKQAQDNSPIEDINATTVYVSDTTLVCYAENNTASSVMGTLSFGESLICTGVGEGWARVTNSSNKVGFCKLSGLSETDPNTSNVALYAQSSGVKVYTKASTSSTVLSTLSLNSKVTAIAKSSDNAWVRLKNGSTYGYALSENFATTPVQDDANSATISKIVELARKQLGIPYVYAAQSPSTGFDCSGFTYYVFKNAAGITLKRTAYTQGYNSSYPTIASRSDLKVGDLVFFNTVDDGATDLCDHVGIYLGSNQFIHASSAKGEVTISSLGSSSSDYYYRTFSWGKRIIS